MQMKNKLSKFGYHILFLSNQNTPKTNLAQTKQQKTKKKEEIPPQHNINPR